MLPQCPCQYCEDARRSRPTLAKAEARALLVALLGDKKIRNTEEFQSATNKLFRILEGS